MKPRPVHYQSLPRSAKYGIIIGVGIPGLIFLIGVVGYAFGKIQACGRRRNPDIELPTTTIAPVVFTTGLDKPTIESYPKTVLGDSGRLPRVYDVTCSICLSEYQPKDTLRTIPECKHYFHATCIDEWLALNATCPVCRKTPETSSTITPCSSMSSSSTSSASTS
ncbi:hypothetical protein RJ640_019045 [Escallonia rubra]|uniref:RING-type E3 ubiquitin transferase n=1 Tax=Escallonia rubra TaxID=112253 RepID=A0AA88QKV6_9ASTE|nr:hypothetical protein RJ640_019045 [Escallonia rubra]